MGLSCKQTVVRVTLTSAVEDEEEAQLQGNVYENLWRDESGFVWYSGMLNSKGIDSEDAFLYYLPLFPLWLNSSSPRLVIYCNC